VTIWHLDPTTVGGGTFDPTSPLDWLLMRSPDGAVWQMTVTNSGVWTSGSEVRMTETDDVRLTQNGLPRTLSGA
jgi:hypothetical protein